MSYVVTDFTFNGKKLSDFNSTLVSFNGSLGFQTIGVSNVSFQTVKNYSTQKYYRTSSNYDEALTTTIYISKKFCNKNSKYYSQNEIRSISKWLNTEIYHKLEFDCELLSGIYFMGSFNINKIMYGKNCVGFELTLTTDSSFGYIDVVSISEISNTVKELNINFTNDRESFVYPLITLSVKEDGDLKIYTQDEPDRILTLDDCVTNDIITFDCLKRTISSSNTSHKLPNKFNFIFPRFNYQFSDVSKKISVNLNCSIKVELQTVVKIGVI